MRASVDCGGKSRASSSFRFSGVVSFQGTDFFRGLGFTVFPIFEFSTRRLYALPYNNRKVGYKKKQFVCKRGKEEGGNSLRPLFIRSFSRITFISTLETQRNCFGQELCSRKKLGLLRFKPIFCVSLEIFEPLSYPYRYYSHLFQVCEERGTRIDLDIKPTISPTIACCVRRQSKKGAKSEC